MSDTPDTPKKERFVLALAKTGNVSEACKTAGIGRKTAYRYREDDPEFASAWNEALDEAADALEGEARRRAVTGTLKPIFHKGAICGKVREYSDTLLIFLLKGARPERYRERVDVNQQHSGQVTVGISFADAVRELHAPADVTEPDADADDCGGATGI